MFECLNTKCKARGTSVEDIANSKPDASFEKGLGTRQIDQPERKPGRQVRGTYIKFLGIDIYRLSLNLAVLAFLGLLIWTGVDLFVHHIFPIFGSIIFIAELIMFSWLTKLMSKNAWRKPSLTSTVFSLLAIVSIFSFAGVEPYSTYKDMSLGYIGNIFTPKGKTPEQTVTPTPTSRTTPTPVQVPIITPVPAPTISPPKTTPVTPAIKSDSPTSSRIWLKNGSYLVGADYSPITLINNPNAKNPSWNQLVEFLRSDNTDKQTYDINRFVCADFAEMLHNNAEKAGWRCAFVSLAMIGYKDPYKLGISPDAGHACNAFETTDRGLVFIDCTGGPRGSGSWDAVVDIKVGKPYNPKLIFLSGGWFIPEGEMGIVTNIEVIQW